ncbi:hypothetical protein GQ457_13G004260 [Hibiscus cannabinus]
MGNFLWFPQFLRLVLLLLLVSGVVCSSSSHDPNTLCVSDDKSALLQFKSIMSTGYENHFCDDSYPKTKWWNESTNCCSWEGVSCDVATGRVIGLDLSCSMLSGSFPQNTSLFRLKGLKQLNLAFNHFNGSSIPYGFSQLVSLEYLNLSGSSLSGLVPSDVSFLTKLTSLDLSFNLQQSFDSHTFEMLTRNLSKLENIFLDRVNMPDVVLTSFNNLPSPLKRLSLQDFQLEYPLRLLDLTGNQFGGPVPASLGNLTRITSLYFGYNLFEGQIPDVFGNLNKLTTLHFSGCSFSGQLPPSLFNLTQLTSLGLSSNGLDGPLPANVTGLQNLKEFRSWSNSLTGGIPSWLFTLPSLESLDLSYNSLTGPIEEIQKPNSVQEVYLESNELYGEIPTSFFGLVNLIDLDLSSNNLSWAIESDMLSKLESLETLDLSSNNLSGVAKSDMLSVTSDTNNGVISTFQSLKSLYSSSSNVRHFPNYLQSVKSLMNLDLSNNAILKWESEGWEQLVYLNLSHNFLTSIEQVPGKNLLTLDLRSNLLQSSLPEPPVSLEEFLISENKFSGEIPPSICNLASLRILDLSKSYLGGIIPACLGNFSNKVSTINLQRNNLGGKIPDFCVDHHLHQLSTPAHPRHRLTTLALNDNQLEGLLPRSLVNCTSLRFLNLANNTLNDLFPHQLSILPDLQVLILRSNGFYGRLDNSMDDSGFLSLQGEFPSEIFQLGNLEYLDLSMNSFTGHLSKSNWSIPSDVFGNLNKLTTLDFSGCNFSGQLPPSLFNLTQLTSLGLSSNGLEGPLPTNVTGLQNLEQFQSESNSLTGGIPSWLFTLPSLESLDLSNNSLNGPINEIKNPNSIQFVYLDLNDIHGEIPTSFFGLVNLIHLDLSSNNLSWVIKSDMLLKLKSLETLDFSLNNLSGVVKLDVLSKLKNLSALDLSNNKLLSMSSDSGVISTFQALQSLDLSSCNVRQFPNSLRSVKSLMYLDISNNAIQGSILNWESEGWEQLDYLNLSHNFLTSIEQFPGKNLQTLDLRSNLLRGSLPAPPASLKELFISENNLDGKIPTSICNLTSLNILDLSKNYLGGIIPICLGNFSNWVSVINLQSNNLRGKIPDFCVDENGLISLALNDNQLEGLLPPSLVNCTSLRFLNLANNTLNGLFPHQLSILPDLQVLILRSNGFYGRIDNSMNDSDFLRLKVFDLSQNYFNGPLPIKFFQSFRAMKVVLYDQSLGAVKVSLGPLFPQIGKCGRGGFDYCIPTLDKNYGYFIKVTMKRLEMELDLDKSLTGFTLIDFSNNRFDGPIPMVLGELGSLIVLNLSHNGLTGPLPPSMGNMAALESLDLSSNKLGGRIPSEWVKLTFLEVLNLSHNNLVGPIPVGNQFNTFENDSYAGNLDLCGFPLSKKCGNEEEPKPPTSRLAEDEGSAIPFIWQLVMMGYGCGLVGILQDGFAESKGKETCTEPKILRGKSWIRGKMQPCQWSEDEIQGVLGV